MLFVLAFSPRILIYEGKFVMKRTIKTANVVLILLMLITQTVLSVQAQSEKNKKPDPAFRDKATHLEKSHKPYYGKNAIVDVYELNGIYYSVDSSNGEVVEIIPDTINYEITATYTEDQLRSMAEEIVVRFLGEKIDLSQMTFSVGQKIGTYFFRWENASKKLEDNSITFIQVGLSQNGDFLNSFNTLPFEHKSPKVQLRVTSSPNLIGPFNEIYANDGAYWSKTGSMTSVTGGYFYLYPSSYCTASYCSKFRYSSSNAAGGWYPNSNNNTKASVFIPGTHAIGGVTYQVKDSRSIVVSNYYVLQNAWYNTWVSITTSASPYGISGIVMQNTSGSEVAWDEAWVYNP